MCPDNEEVVSREILINYFQAGETPCEQHFEDLIKSFVHRTEDGVTICKYPTLLDGDVETVSAFTIEAKTEDVSQKTELHLDGENGFASLTAGEKKRP